jgi:hypothetical protein
MLPAGRPIRLQLRQSAAPPVCDGTARGKCRSADPMRAHGAFDVRKAWRRARDDGSLHSFTNRDQAIPALVGLGWEMCSSNDGSAEMNHLHGMQEVSGSSPLSSTHENPVFPKETRAFSWTASVPERPDFTDSCRFGHHSVPFCAVGRGQSPGAGRGVKCGTKTMPGQRTPIPESA